MFYSTRTLPSTGVLELDVELVKYLVSAIVADVYRDNSAIVTEIKIKQLNKPSMLVCTAAYTTDGRQ